MINLNCNSITVPELQYLFDDLQEDMVSRSVRFYKLINDFSFSYMQSAMKLSIEGNGKTYCEAVKRAKQMENDPVDLVFH